MKAYDKDNPEHVERNRKYARTWYGKNKKKRKDAVAKRLRRNRAWLQEHKKTLSCIQCGENHPATLDFHHRDPDSKTHIISQLVGQGWGMKRILAEIDKCDVLCANCHRIVHYNERE